MQNVRGGSFARAHSTLPARPVELESSGPGPKRYEGDHAPARRSNPVIASVKMCGGAGKVRAQSPSARSRVLQVIDSKGRDDRVVYGARLESEVLDRHRPTLKRVNAHAISRLTL
jgi:hypothetical protein